MSKRIFLLFSTLGLLSCMGQRNPADQIVPAEEFSKALRNGTVSDYSFNRIAEQRKEAAKHHAASDRDAGVDADDSQPPAADQAQARAQFRGDPRLLSAGYELKKSVSVPSSQIDSSEGAALAKTEAFEGQHPSPPALAAYAPSTPPGSAAPYQRSNDGQSFTLA